MSNRAKRITAASEFHPKGRFSNGRSGRSNESWINQAGEINAYSKKDMFVQMKAALEEILGGNRIVPDNELQTIQEITAAHRESILASFEDPQYHRELGQILAAELTISANKQGFMRQLMRRQDLTQGQDAKVQLQMKNVTAVIASGPTRCETQFVRDEWFYPPEFYVSVRPYVEQRDINRANIDVLEQKYIESMEGIMVAEDRTWRAMALAAVGTPNEAITTVGTLTPLVLAQIRNQVQRWRIPAANLLIASDIWIDVVGDSDFAVTLDPVSKHELFLSGELGVMLGMRVYTDAYRHATHHVLAQGEIWVVGEAGSHGQYTDRGGVTSEPISGVNENVPGRGWFMCETMSLAIANSRSVAYATRT